MKPMVVPTRDNAWMVALWIPFLLAIWLVPGKEPNMFVAGLVSVAEVLILIWVIVRMRWESTVEFDNEVIRVKRRNRVIKEITVADIERIVLSGATFSVYGRGKSLPLVMRAIRLRNKQDKGEYLNCIREWSQRRKVMLQG